MNSAITSSDNISGEQLWASLGDPSTAAGKVQNTLAASGDTSTVVESRILRPEFTAFGQTDWSLPAQAQFAASLPCRDDSAFVLDAMGSIISDQQWGLGTITGSQFKGGWGPGADGGYLVRQFGIIPSGTGQLAVAIAAEPTSGSFDDGTAMLTEIGRWIGERAEVMPVGATC